MLPCFVVHLIEATDRPPVIRLYKALVLLNVIGWEPKLQEEPYFKFSQKRNIFRAAVLLPQFQQ